MVKDQKALTNLAKTELPGLPFVLFGHSMGSFVARSYSELYGNEMTAAIYCGTAGKNPAAGIGISLTNFLMKRKGSRARGELIDQIAFGSYNKKFKPQRTKFDWLSRDEKIVDAYIADPYCGYLFTLAGYRDLMELMQQVNRKAWYQNVPYVLPILLIAGEMDPVGEYGKGVNQVYEDLKANGHKDVRLILYPEGRHEILNEPEKEQVYQDVIAWIEKQIQPK